jgi:hypothetical protein
MPLIVMGEVFPFESVMACAEVLVPRTVLAKAMLVGLAATMPVVPVPERVIACGLLPSESLKLRIAARVPVAVGPKTIFAVQLAPAASVAPQVLLKTVKSAGLAPLKLMLLKLIGTAFAFVSVTTFCPLFVPTATAAHESEEGEAAAAPVDAPDPDRATSCGLLVAESTKLRVAARAPVALGRKMMVAVQVAEIAMLLPQVVLDSTKSEALLPETAMLLMVMGAAGPFDSVTICAALLAPTAVPEKERLVGDADAVAGVTPPIPESATACGLLVAESVKVRLAARVPAALGLNTRVAAQLAFTERLAPHVLPETTKSDALAPVTATLLMVMGEVLPLVSVTVCGEELDPTAVLANAMLDGLAATTPLVPRPDSATVCGLLVSESLKLRIAVRAPVAVGPKTMFAVQLAPAASVAPQVLL